jgi:hypothetical protein
MKISELFESKVITEGTWALPNTPALTKKFIALMSKPLSGKDASTKLYHVLGDDILFDELHDLEKSEDVRLVVMKAMKRILKGTWFEGDDQKEALKDFIKKSERTIAESVIKVDFSRGKKVPMTALQAFGSEQMNVLHDLGIELTEKPSYWEDFERDGFASEKNIHNLQMRKAEKALGSKFVIYEGGDLFGVDKKGNDKPSGPLVSPAFIPKETMFIVKFSDGTKYLCDLSGAKTYIRNWQKIV